MNFTKKLVEEICAILYKSGLTDMVFCAPLFFPSVDEMQVS